MRLRSFGHHHPASVVEAIMNDLKEDQKEVSSSHPPLTTSHSKDEGDDTLSWTSSMAESLTPENPLFVHPNTKTSEHDGETPNDRIPQPQSRPPEEEAASSYLLIDTGEEDEDLVDQQQELHEKQTRLQLHHMRMPSTIEEETTANGECDDDDNPVISLTGKSQGPPNQNERFASPPVLFHNRRPLERKAASLSDLTMLHSHANTKNAHRHPNTDGSILTSPVSLGSPPSESTVYQLPPNQSYPPNLQFPDLPKSNDDTTKISTEGLEQSTSSADTKNSPLSPSFSAHRQNADFTPHYPITHVLQAISLRCFQSHYTNALASATWIGFWALLHVTCANYVLTPMRDAIALAVGVDYMPKLTLASTLLAFCSSVPIGWLFEAPDPNRRRVWKRMGLTRGETQGTSLALFYRCFALILLSYAIGFPLLEWLKSNPETVSILQQETVDVMPESMSAFQSIRSMIPDVATLLNVLVQALYIAFFLVVHLMKLHSLSLMWGVTTEAMEYEDVARKKVVTTPSNTGNIMADSATPTSHSPSRLQRLALIGFGGTLGGILGSVLASSLAQVLYLPGLLVLAAALLEISAELSIELGRIMQKHWEEQQLFQSTNDLSSLDTSMRRSVSLGSMKRVASGNSLNRTRSATDLNKANSPGAGWSGSGASGEPQNDNTFVQRLLRGVTTILRSRLLMAIFTYNALYASTTVLLSFQRAALVANRNETTSKEADMAFLANINIASSVAIFALQASGIGAFLAQTCGPRGTLALMPLIRLAGVLALAWWHHVSEGKPPNLLVFLVVDECCKIMNLAVAKPVRESLWRGLSNEARYEAKPIVDTLANRWGGGSAAFLVSTLNRILDLFGVVAAADGSRMVFGYPPIIFLCVVIAAWWTVVSADLGQIRKNIDAELKKRQ